ncbi:MbtH family NRPS accessory protein [Streptomyces sp. NPDC002935]|uniref:MbtH family protein n=1 Tax=Streptomyces sp. NPDC002935 TaxID=3154545 RepID=UPI0033A227A7
MAEEFSDDALYRVVLNDEEQYSIWWLDRELPDGWSAEGTEGTREQCLSRIEEVWTDMRPLSLRLSMEQSALA